MAKTFDDVYTEAALNYNYLFARIVLEADFEQPDAPPIVAFFSWPALFLQAISNVYSTITKSGYSQIMPLDYVYTHKKPEFLLSQLLEIDAQSEESDVLKVLGTIRNTLKAGFGNDVVESNDNPDLVRIYGGYDEEASRMLFPYGDRFAHLSEMPVLRTYNKYGIEVNERKPLPVRPEHEEKDPKTLEIRALIAYAKPETFDFEAGRTLLDTEGDTYVVHRANNTYGLSHIWTTKFDDGMKKSFICSTVNPDTAIFKPQKVYEFKRTLCKIFGDDATSRVPIVYARLSKPNRRPVYTGTAEALEKFLRDRPDVVDQLNIAKLFPGGFVAVVTKKGNKFDGYKHFDFSAGQEYVLYTRLGYQEMACIKLLSEFETECTLQTEVDATADIGALYSA